jgi:putative ABC transport system substrate-binding protein
MLLSNETRPRGQPVPGKRFNNAGLVLDSEDSDIDSTLLPAVNTLLPRVECAARHPRWNDLQARQHQGHSGLFLSPSTAGHRLLGRPSSMPGRSPRYYTTPAQIARQTADLINNMGTTLPPPVPPSQFAITINSNVAEALGLSIPDEATIRRAMLAESEAR